MFALFLNHIFVPYGSAVSEAKNLMQMGALVGHKLGDAC